MTMVNVQSPDFNINKPKNRLASDDESNSRTRRIAWPWIVLVCVAVVVVGGIAAGVVCGTGKCTKTTPDKPPATTAPPNPDSDGDTAPQSTLKQVRRNGRLKCGVAPGTFQLTDSEGFSADLCRAIAAAALGTSRGENVDFVEVTTFNQFATLLDGTVDVLAADTAITMERDLLEPTSGAGFTFSTPYLYTGLIFAGDPVFVDCADDLDATGNCSSFRICSVKDATHSRILQDIYPGASLLLTSNLASSFENLRQGICQVVAGERFTVSPDVVPDSTTQAEYAVGENLFSKEPIAFATRDGDPEWSDFVNWVLQGLLYAQEIGITQTRAASLRGTSDVFGPEFTNMFADAVSFVGNYGEIYMKHFENIIPGVNGINTGNSGLMYAMPFGEVATVKPATRTIGTLADIRNRGILHCGIVQQQFFAVKDQQTGEFSGFDIDFCRALSAAIFDGEPDKVQYTDLSATERFLSLANGDVDVLSRETTVTFSRDVSEPSSKTGFSFSQSNFYDGLGFLGIPPFGRCADTLDTTGECALLSICVGNGTTFQSRVQELFPPENIVVKKRTSLAAQGLQNGDCNAIAGGFADFTLANSEAGGDTVKYELGSNFFTKDPLALVTRQDDQHWSSFVYWVVSSIFFAEERGITQRQSNDMPLVHAFGPTYSRMFRNAIGGVGNYAQIYNRSVAAYKLPRSSLNRLNENPFGPQHYPYPGI